jgi:hypothetical protein
MTTVFKKFRMCVSPSQIAYHRCHFGDMKRSTRTSNRQHELSTDLSSAFIRGSYPQLRMGEASMFISS